MYQADPLHFRAQTLEARLQGCAPETMLLEFRETLGADRLALVSSFGAESAVLLHMAARLDRAFPVLFIDTEMLFPETLRYQADLAAHLGLTDIRRLRADTRWADPDDTLHQSDPDACCDLRKTAPLTRALKRFSGWVSGRKRFQSGRRAMLPLVEADAATGTLKLNPLADWSPGDIAAYMTTHVLPRHPLVAKGFPSIGCAPCTSRVHQGEDPRAGRWRGSAKDECGIHFHNGKAIRTGATT